MGKFTLAEMFAFMLSSLLVCSWIVTGHWFLMDCNDFILDFLFFKFIIIFFYFLIVIGVGFCVTFIAIVRLPSLKVSTLLLCGLVIYDVLWVKKTFFSPKLLTVKFHVHIYLMLKIRSIFPI
jgi:signal peptide peptidase-like protein 3